MSILIDGTYMKSGIYHFYITDHLGSNRVVANTSGTAVQKNHYYRFGAAFAETAVAEQGKQPYKYNGKELDPMHGLNWHDYGARHYDAALGRWHTVDPLAEKYYSISPYAYCANNPVKFIDPDEEDIVIYYKDDNNKTQTYNFNGTYYSNIPINKFVKQVIEAYLYNVGNGGGEPSLVAATNDNISINVVEYDNSSIHINGTVFWNPSVGGETETIVRSPATVLDHELDHAVQRATNNKQFEKDRSTPDVTYDNKEEKRVIIGSEQNTAKANGEIKNGQVTRKGHYGKSVITKGVTSNKIDYEKTAQFKKLQERKTYEWTSEPR